ncbi:MAG TPA: HAMP domain-containing protein [Leptolyngbyaceae cyanobacterium M65_K2018_010]|nr:HAMP domain-containing protein [Leptolyngbyaceae cyanobacterium M65_K2018_010]
MTEAAYNQLLGLRNARAQAIETFFNTLQEHTLTLSYQTMVVDAINQFKPAVQTLNDSRLAPAQMQELENYYAQEIIPKLKQNIGGNPTVPTYFPPTAAAQYLNYYYTAKNPYPAEREKLINAGDGSDYSKIHEQFHNRFRVVAQVFDYYDIFLIDIDTGVVLYSVTKEIDFGTNLKTGPFSDSGLARAYEMVRKSRDPEFVGMIDFEQYQPTYGKPSAFVGTTVFDGDEFTGALVIQIPSDRIDQIMNANEKWEEVGLGKTGETYLVGPDNLLRSTTRFFIEDPEAYFKTLGREGGPTDQIALMKSAQTPLLIQQDKTVSTQNALNGKSGIDSHADYRGVAVLGAYQPIKLGDFDWALIAKMDQNEIFKGIRDLTKRLLVSAAILVPLITLLSIWLAKSFLTPIRKLMAGTHEIAAGNSDVEVHVKSQDEFGELANSFNTMAKTLHEKELAIQSQMQENDRLLLTILPPKAAERMKSGEQDIADSYPNVTVLYATLEGFNSLSAELSPEQAIVLLNEVIGAFDEAAEQFGVEKLRSMGSTYLAVCGLSVPRVDHAKRTVDFALAMLTIVRRFSQKQGVDLSLDIGIHTGPIAAGVVGKRQFNYEVWGETINIARGIHQSPGQNVIQVTKSVVDGLQGLYHFQQVADIAVKGRGKLPVWEVTPLAAFAAEAGVREA